jgi:Glycosyl transferase family 2
MTSQYSHGMVRRAGSDARLDGAPSDQGGGSDRAAVTPQISVVLCTSNRADRVGAATGAILDQHGADLELVVVDDGSTDGTPSALAAIDDARMRVVRRPNGGLSAARNSGLAAARAPWVVFIDDDDEAQPGWLAAFLELGADESVGIACCGAQFVDADGNDLFTRPPSKIGPPFGDLVASTLAGAFAVRTDLARRAGGYLDGLGTRHQTELFIRLLALAEPAGLRVANVPDLLIHIEARLATDRPGVNPRRLYDGTRWIMARHPAQFAPGSSVTGVFEGVVGTNAARLGDWSAARRRLLRSVRATPRAPEAWGRLALAAVPLLGNLVWNRHGAWATHDPSEVGLLRQLPPAAGGEIDATAGAGPNGAAGARELFLPWRYQENPPSLANAGATADGEPAEANAPTPARWLTTRLARRHRWAPVVHVDAPGAGPGQSGPPPAHRAEHGGGPLVVSLDALDQVDDPVALLHRLSEAVGDGRVLVTTADPSVVDPDRPLGPPSDLRRRRAWTEDQLELLLLSCGLDVEQRWRLPESATSTWRHRLAARWPGLPVPGVPRPTLAVLARRRGEMRTSTEPPPSV